MTSAPACGPTTTDAAPITGVAALTPEDRATVADTIAGTDVEAVLA